MTWTRPPIHTRARSRTCLESHSGVHKQIRRSKHRSQGHSTESSENPNIHRLITHSVELLETQISYILEQKTLMHFNIHNIDQIRHVKRQKSHNYHSELASFSACLRTKVSRNKMTNMSKLTCKRSINLLYFFSHIRKDILVSIQNITVYLDYIILI